MGTIPDTASGPVTTGDQGAVRAAHTPGPWKVLDYSTGTKGFIAVVTDGDVEGHVADVFPFGARSGAASRELERHAANARLIAAAPDMLTALKLCELRHATSPHIGLIRAAIAKATGATP